MLLHRLFLLRIIFLPNFLFAQVGIGTNTPDASAQLEVKSTTKGLLPPRVALTSTNSASPVSSPASGLIVYNTATAGASPNNVTPGFYFWDTNVWTRLTTPSDNPVATVGDVKSGFQSADHAGWVKLNGRAVSTLSSSQQAAAATLGITGNLPNADNAYLSQNGSTIGTVTTSNNNTVTLVQANLPNINFSGTAASNGSHAHYGTTSSDGAHNHSPQGNSGANGTFLKTGFEGSGAGVGGGSAFTTASTTTTNGAHTHTYNTSIDGSHTHTVSVSSGGSGTAFSIAPRSLTVNMFIYLGL